MQRCRAGIEQQLAALDDVRPGAALGVGLAEALPAQQCPDALDQQALGKGLLDVVVGAQAQAHELVHLVVLRGEEDDRQVALLAQPLQKLEPVHARHLDVEDGEIDRLGGQAPQRLGPVGIGPHGEALGFQGHGNGGQDVAVVVDERDGLRHGLPVPFVLTQAELPKMGKVAVHNGRNRAELGTKSKTGYGMPER